MIVTVNAHTLEELHNIVIDRVRQDRGHSEHRDFVEMQRTEKEPVYTAK